MFSVPEEFCGQNRDSGAISRQFATGRLDGLADVEPIF
jgi:hypothetical protein